MLRLKHPFWFDQDRIKELLPYAGVNRIRFIGSGFNLLNSCGSPQNSNPYGFVVVTILPSPLPVKEKFAGIFQFPSVYGILFP